MFKLTLLTIAFAFLTMDAGYSQNRESINVKLDKRAIVKRNEGMHLFELTGSKIEQNEKTVPIKLPAAFPMDKANAYFFFSYGVTGSGLGVVLVADYKSPAPVLYFDRNSNFDFTDDGAPVAFKSGIAEISFHNQAQPGASTTLSFSKIRMDEEREKAYLEMQKFLYKSPKAEYTLPRYWIAMNPIAKVGHFHLNGMDFTIGFYDVNSDGIISRNYTDDALYSGDRLLFAEGKKDTLYAEFEKNGYKIFEDVAAFSRANIKIEAFDSLGTYAKVNLTDQPATVNRIKEGEVLPSFSYQLIDSTTTSDIYSLKGNGKYKLIEFWGMWCRGCVQIIPELRSLHAEMEERLDIISLNFKDDDAEKVAKFIKTKEMTWHHGFSTLGLNRKLGVSMFPYSILLDEDFRIIALQVRPDFVKEYISKTSTSTK
jgi:thiol-disulfide isomerase/thioredoxin